MSRPSATRLRPAAMTWWQVVGLAVVLVVFPAYSLVLLAFLAPVIVIHALRPETGESAAVPSLFFVLAVALHPLHTLWLDGGDWAAGRALLTNGRLLCMIYLAGATAWVIVDVSTMVMRLMHLQSRKAKANRLREEARTLREEWQIPEPDEPAAGPA